MVAGRDVGLDVARLLERVLEERRGDRGHVDRLAADLKRRAGDDVDRIERVLVRARAVGGVDVVDQPFVERPGVHPAFPVVDDRVAEAEGFRLLIGLASRDPGGTGGVEGRVGRPGDQVIDRRVEGLRRLERVPVAGERDVGIGRNHGLRLDGRGLAGDRRHSGRKQRHGGKACRAHDQGPHSRLL